VSTPPNKEEKAGALGRHKGATSCLTSRSPRRPAKQERLKEPHESVRSERPAPIPSDCQKTKANRDCKSRTVVSRPPQRKPGGKDKTASRCGKTQSGRPYPKKKGKRVVYQKWHIPQESWNLKRSPRLVRLRKSLAKVVRGKCPFYQFKDLLRNVKIRSLGSYNRYKSILEGGFLLTRRSIGIGILPPIRKVVNLSFREMEILISKLPFWATSYDKSHIRRVAILARNQASSRTMRNTESNPNGVRIRLRAPLCSVVRTIPRANRRSVGISGKHLL
jgi:hypothetical protein